MSLTVSAHEMPYALCFCSTTGILVTSKLIDHIVPPYLHPMTAASLVLVMLVTNVLLAKGVYLAVTLVFKVLKIYVWMQ